MVGKAIRYMRKSKKLNQKNLADIINVKQNTLSRYETESTDINFKTLEEIAEICGYRIYFDNGKDRFQVKDLGRKDI